MSAPAPPLQRSPAGPLLSPVVRTAGWEPHLTAPYEGIDVLASLGRRCYRHRRTVAGAWLVLTVGLFLVGTQAFGRLGVDYSGSSIESFAGFDMIDDNATYGARIPRPVDDVPDRRPGGGRPGSGRPRPKVARVPHVGRVVDPYDGRAPASSPPTAAAAWSSSTWTGRSPAPSGTRRSTPPRPGSGS